MELEHLESTLFPYTTLFRSHISRSARAPKRETSPSHASASPTDAPTESTSPSIGRAVDSPLIISPQARAGRDRKSTRLNSSHQIISYAVFCLKKKKHHAAPL